MDLILPTTSKSFDSSRERISCKIKHQLVPVQRLRNIFKFFNYPNCSCVDKRGREEDSKIESSKQSLK